MRLFQQAADHRKRCNGTGTGFAKTDTTWYGFWAPARTSEAIVNKINAAAAKVLAAAETRAALEKAGIEAKSTSAERFGLIVRFELAKWTAFIRGANIAPLACTDLASLLPGRNFR